MGVTRGTESEWLGVYKGLDTLVETARAHVLESVLATMARRESPLAVRKAWPGMSWTTRAAAVVYLSQ
jgi:hypothetical protein